MTHSIYVRRNSMSDRTLNVHCTCGNLFEYAEYTEVLCNGGPDTGVPLSVLMDIAEKHQHDEDARNGL